VTGITGVPTAATAGTQLTLTGTVAPANATNRNITWSIHNAGGTNATITSGNLLNTTAAGTVTVRATIVNGLTATTNFVQDFNITVTLPTPTLTLSTSSISLIPGQTSGAETQINVSAPLPLPPGHTVVWITNSANLQLTPNANGSTVTVSAAGVSAPETAIITATLMNGSTPVTGAQQTVSVTIAWPSASVTQPPPATMTVGDPLMQILATITNPNNVTGYAILWESTNTGVVSIAGNYLTVLATGTATVTASLTYNGVPVVALGSYIINVAPIGG